METKKAVAIKEVAPVEIKASPSALIELAISKGADLDKLEKLLLLQEKYDAMEAKKAYHRAMAAFKAKAPETVLKNKKVSYATKAGGKVEYNHATLANVVKAITSGLSEQGLSVSWPLKQDAGRITVTCRITHDKGYCEEFSLTGPADDSGGKNAIQAIGSTTQYLERYTLLAATGLATEGQDDDGQSSEAVEYIDEAQRGELIDLATDCNANMLKFMAYLKVEDLAKLPKADFQKAKLALIAKKGQAKK